MKCFLTFVLLSITTAIFAQQEIDTRSKYQYQIKKMLGNIVIDGLDDDEGWNFAGGISHFMNHWPLDSGVSSSPTEVKLTYDNDFIYLLAICHDEGDRIIQTLKRDKDQAHWNSDNFTLILDPIGNKQSGFMFGVNAGGAQIEASVNANGVQSDYDQNWDNKWYSEVKRYGDKWIVEMAIPFKTLRFSNNNTTWGFNVIRGDLIKNSYSTWTQFPVNFGGIHLNYTGSLSWESAPKQSKGKVVLIPYIAGGTSRDFENEEGNTEYQQEIDAGIDAKIALTSALNLDLTVNPDFSNIDVDQQVTNLSRFSIFFPERRNFFLENGDIFSNYGGESIKPFFSRTIGLSEGQQIPIAYGARLTGNLTPVTRIGVMNIQSRPFLDITGNNFTVASVNQRVFKRSLIKAIAINRQATGNGNNQDFSRNFGIEYQYNHLGGKWNNTFLVHNSITEERLNKNYYYGFNGRYANKNLRIGWTFDAVGENYLTELGFNPRIYNYNAETEETSRQGIIRINPYVVYRWFPSNPSNKLNTHGIRTWHTFWLNTDRSLNERTQGLAYDFSFKNTSWLSFNRLFSQINLPVPTNLIGSDTPLPIDNYNFAEYWVSYDSDNRKIISTNWKLGYGDFYNGSRLDASAGFNLRVQPWGTFGLNYNLNKVELAENYGDATLHLFKVNAEISFSNTMFWTTSIQYNSQAENYNFFSRFQWRFKPMSDFFIVYTDNYTTDGLNIKNRQFVFKLTYWLNM
jgi:hypothetical protein